MPRPRKPASPFRYFNSPPEVIRLVVVMYVRFPLSLRNVEDLLFERSIDIFHETVRHWWNRFGPMFAVDIRRRQFDIGARAIRCGRHPTCYKSHISCRVGIARCATLAGPAECAGFATPILFFVATQRKMGRNSGFRKVHCKPLLPSQEPTNTPPSTACAH